MNIVVFC